MGPFYYRSFAVCKHAFLIRVRMFGEQVLLQLYDKFGTNFCHLLNGIFAFVISQGTILLSSS